MSNNVRIKISAAVCNYNNDILQILDSRELGVNRAPVQIEDKNLSDKLPGEDEMLTW